MEIRGEWLLCDDGAVRPVIHAAVVRIDGKPVAFDVILSKRRGEVLLLGLNHRYTISPGS